MIGINQVPTGHGLDLALTTIERKRGRSHDLKVLAISPDGVSFNNAEDPRGKDTLHTEDEVNERFGRTQKGWKAAP